MTYRRRRDRQLPLVTALALLALSALLAALLPQLVTLQGVQPALSWAWRHPGPVLLVFLGLLALESALFAGLGRLWPAFLLTALPPFILALVSFYKTRINGTPLLLEDLHLSGNLLHIAGYAGARLRLTWPSLLAIGLLAAGTLGLAWLPRLRGRVRLALLLPGLALLAAFLLPSAFRGLAVAMSAGCVSQEERVEELGVVWGFYSAWSVSSADRSDVRKRNQELEENLTSLREDLQVAQPPASPAVPAAGQVTPTVIFLMSESFFDLSRLPGVQYETDPQPCFHRLADESTSGRFLSSTFCGGTAYVELEVQTGLCSYLLSEGDTLPALPAGRYETLPTVAGVLADRGYDRVFLHSHTSTLYNRAEIYAAMGFDQVLFRDAFPADVDYAGGYISDMALTEEIIRLYEARDPASPLFLSAVSMENHQPYSDGKYGGADACGLSAPALDETGLASLRAYTQGAVHADAALGALTDYFAAQDQPVMLVFWGDHLPSLGAENGETVYSQLGFCDGPVTTDWSPEVLCRMLSTDYLIWTNYETETPPDGPESGTFLGLDVLTRLSLEPGGYFGWLRRQVEPGMLLYRPRLFVDADGQASPEPPPDFLETLAAYRTVVGDLVYGDGLLFEEETP